MKKRFLVMIMALLFCMPASAGDLSARASEAFNTAALEDALPKSAGDYLQEISPEAPGDLGEGVGRILLEAFEDSQGALKRWIAMCLRICAVVLLCAMIKGFGDSRTVGAVELAALLALGMCCLDRVSGIFTQTAQTVDSMSVFANLLFSVLASATAATGAVGTAGTIYGVTVALCGVMSRLLQNVFLPCVSCYMALMLADYALGDSGLSVVGDMIKQLITNGLKFAVIAFSAYLSLTGVISGSADSAAVKAAKLGISSVVPVVGSMIADASETLLVSAGLIRSAVGVFGLLGVLAVSIGPFLETGLGYLTLKATAAVASTVGEKRLSGFISSMAGAMGLVTGLTGVCTVLIMVSCVCFMSAGTR